MFTRLSPTGFRNNRESRLLGMTTGSGLPEAGRDAQNLWGVDTINSFFNSIISGAEAVLSPEEVRARGTAAKLRNPVLWIRAFLRADLLTMPQRAASTLRGAEFGPDEWLQTMSREQRVAQFYRFIQNTIPQNVRNTHPMFALREFREPIDTVLAGGALVEPTDGMRQQALNAANVILGQNAPEAGSVAADIASRSFEEIYPAERMGGRLLEHYLREVSRIRTATAGSPNTPSNEDLRSRDYLLRALRPLSRSTFYGWLNATDPTVAQARLAGLADLREKLEAANRAKTLGLQLMVKQSDNKEKEAAEKANTNVMTNIEVAWQTNPVATAVAAGVIGFALWKMMRSKGRFLGVIPYSVIPIALGGTYLYLAANGDPNPLNTMLGTSVGFINSLVGGAQSMLRRGVLPATVAQQDQKSLALMSRFLNEKAFLSIFPVAGPMMLAAEVPVRMFAGNTFRMDFNPVTGRIKYGLYAEPQDPLYLTMQKIMRERGYNQNTVHQIFHDHNEQIAEGLGNVFYQLAARESHNSASVKLIEDARHDNADLGGVPNLSYGNIRNPSIMRLYHDIMQEGRTLAMERYPNKSLVEIVQLLMEENETARLRPEGQRVNVPGVAPNVTRGRELDLYSNRNTPLTIDREIAMQDMHKEFAEWLDFTTRKEFSIIDPGARKALEEFANNLFSLDPSNTRTIQQTMIIAEQVKYGILVSCGVRAGGSRLTAANIARITGPAATPDGPNVKTVMDAVAQWINAELGTIASNFQNVGNINHVLVMLRPRLFAAIGSEPAGLTLLRAQLERHRKRFEALRTPPQMAEQFVNRLPPRIVMRFAPPGGTDPAAARKLALEFIRQIVDTQQFRNHVNDTEQYYAQRVANGLVTAQIGEHRETGFHVLENELDDRWVSPTEELNQVDDNEFLINNLLGPEDRPLSGIMATMGMQQLLQEFSISQVQDIPTGGDILVNESERIEALDRTRMLAFLYLGLRPIAPDEAVDIQLRQRVRTVAEKWLQQYDVAAAASRPALRKLPSFNPGVKHIIGTMNILEMDVDSALRDRLLAVLNATDEAADKDAKETKDKASGDTKRTTDGAEADDKGAKATKDRAEIDRLAKETGDKATEARLKKTTADSAEAEAKALRARAERASKDAEAKASVEKAAKDAAKVKASADSAEADAAAKKVEYEKANADAKAVKALADGGDETAKKTLERAMKDAEVKKDIYEKAQQEAAQKKAIVDKASREIRETIEIADKEAAALKRAADAATTDASTKKAEYEKADINAKAVKERAEKGDAAAKTALEAATKDADVKKNVYEKARQEEAKTKGAFDASEKIIKDATDRASAASIEAKRVADAAAKEELAKKAILDRANKDAKEVADKARSDKSLTAAAVEKAAKAKEAKTAFDTAQSNAENAKNAFEKAERESKPAIEKAVNEAKLKMVSDRAAEKARQAKDAYDKARGDADEAKKTAEKAARDFERTLESAEKDFTVKTLEEKAAAAKVEATKAAYDKAVGETAIAKEKFDKDATAKETFDKAQQQENAKKAALETAQTEQATIKAAAENAARVLKAVQERAAAEKLKASAEKAAGDARSLGDAANKAEADAKALKTTFDEASKAARLAKEAAAKNAALQPAADKAEIEAETKKIEFETAQENAIKKKITAEEAVKNAKNAADTLAQADLKAALQKSAVDTKAATDAAEKSRAQVELAKIAYDAAENPATTKALNDAAGGALVKKSRAEKAAAAFKESVDKAVNAAQVAKEAEEKANTEAETLKRSAEEAQNEFRKAEEDAARDGKLKTAADAAKRKAANAKAALDIAERDVASKKALKEEAEKIKIAAERARTEADAKAKEARDKADKEVRDTAGKAAGETKTKSSTDKSGADVAKTKEAAAEAVKNLNRDLLRMRDTINKLDANTVIMGRTRIDGRLVQATERIFPLGTAQLILNNEGCFIVLPGQTTRSQVLLDLQILNMTDPRNPVSTSDHAIPSLTVVAPRAAGRPSRIQLEILGTVANGSMRDLPPAGGAAPKELIDAFATFLRQRIATTTPEHSAIIGHYRLRIRIP